MWNFFQSHTNADGFWEDLNLISSAGLNIGYHPTGKSFNLAGRDPALILSDDDLKKVCLDAFGIDADIDSDAFGQTYFGGDLPDLLDDGGIASA